MLVTAAYRSIENAGTREDSWNDYSETEDAAAHKLAIYIQLHRFLNVAWRLQDLGRRRRKVIRRTVKPYPTMFLCPVCHHETVTVDVHRDEKKAIITCSNCNLTDEVEILPVHMPVDAYCLFYDRIVKQEALAAKGSEEPAPSQERPPEKVDIGKVEEKQAE